MMRFYAKRGDGQGVAGIGLKKYETLYKATFDSSGVMLIEKADSLGQTIEVARKQIKPVPQGKDFFMQFSDVDHLLAFEVNKQKLTYDLGTGKDDAGKRINDMEPKAVIFGSGNLIVSNVALYRDIYYLSTRIDTQQPVNRAGEENPFTLGKDEYFAMGDNSPDSLDSRLWDKEGFGNNGISYRMGIVPRDYLVGKAFFVYWPSGFRAGNFKFPFVPNVGKLRFIYGGN